ncbi:MAG: hypothetical protein QOK42_855 [Frankiaceae bacterium]|nr:hypothetical protein [Frankiaceae bacterium]
MPDLSELFALVSQPNGEPDLGAIERRARVRRQRQVAAVVGAAAAAVLVVAIPLAASQPNSLDRITPAPGDSAPATTSPSSPPAPVGTRAPAGGGQPTAGPQASAPATAGPTAAAEPTSSAAPPPTASPFGGGGDYPVQETCSVSTMTLAPGQSATCRFTAAAAGGWKVTFHNGAGYVNRVSTSVTVLHNGVARTYGTDKPCGTALIHAGDRVTLTIKQTDVGYLDTGLDAGRGYSC